MANWCHNCVRLTGEPENIAAVNAFFKAIEHQQEQGNYELPDFITAKNKGMFEIWFRDEHIHFRSAWSPPINALIEIADHFETGFINKYEEPGMFVYGKAYYHEGELDGVSLTRADAEQIGYDEEREVFLFEGKEFDNDEVIIYSLYAKKITDFEASHPVMAGKITPSPTANDEPLPGQEQVRKAGLKR
ncbi:hypothetical protein [Mucilaginibacter aquariorum]|uniref:YubB ferredoxin-like domain-containing protein n=1 Tax=Mucilaginibacter aquariorum TaxID=2967225 RepID=A0ABT1T2D6_9SPHI|nr:hypothetical protein [Mucilaginibacter aquariorum]MCQ6958773.1 hypothetical protein [Mucilaginibacter aquariorum]